MGSIVKHSATGAKRGQGMVCGPPHDGVTGTAMGGKRQLGVSDGSVECGTSQEGWPSGRQYSFTMRNRIFHILSVGTTLQDGLPWFWTGGGAKLKKKNPLSPSRQGWGKNAPCSSFLQFLQFLPPKEPYMVFCSPVRSRKPSLTLRGATNVQGIVWRIVSSYLQMSTASIMVFSHKNDEFEFQPANHCLTALHPWFFLH